MIKVDKTIVISLHDHEARQALALQESRKLKLQPEFFLSQRDVENGERGCFKSHVDVARVALKEKCRSLLVFEDDVKILNFTDCQIDAINKFSRNKNFDLLYLGLIPAKMWFSGFSFSIVRAKGSCLHAYLLSASGIEKMSRYEYQGLAIDEVVKRDFKCYSVYPLIAVQQPESEVESTISAFRNHRKQRRLKNEAYWQMVCRKQKRRLLMNLHRSIYDFLCSLLRIPCRLSGLREQ